MKDKLKKSFTPNVDKALRQMNSNVQKEGSQDPSVEDDISQGPSGPGIGPAPNAPANASAGWKEVYELARKAGDLFPEITASQWALESGWGKHQSGKNNLFGQKASRNQPHTVVNSKEYKNGQWVMQPSRFRDYNTKEEGIKERLDRWWCYYCSRRNG